MSIETKDLQHEMSEIAPMRSTALTGQDVPQRVLLAPWGLVESTNGSFVVDEESVDLIQAAFERHGTDLPIDYEHQTLGGSYASPSGQAPAAGWIKQIESQPGVGLVAHIEWTPQAREQLLSRQYRYLSPVAIVRKEDRKMVGLHSAALTNKPAIVGAEPIINRAGQAVEPEPITGLSELARELHLPEDAQPRVILLAACEKLGVLRREAHARRIDNRVQEAMRSGRLIEAQRQWAQALLERDESLFEQYVSTCPVLVPQGATRSPGSGSVRSARPFAIAAQARAEFNSHPMLSKLTTQKAFEADALRQQGFDPRDAANIG